jgi:hypothetical protein
MMFTLYSGSCFLHCLVCMTGTPLPLESAKVASDRIPSTFSISGVLYCHDVYASRELLRPSPVVLYIPADASSRARWDEQTLVQIIDGDKI